MKVSRTQLWMDSLGDWSWPGRAADAAEALPPAWVPAFPPRLAIAPAAGEIGAPPSDARSRRVARWRLLLIGALLSALAAVCTALALRDSFPFASALGLRSAAPADEIAASPSATAEQTPPLLTLVAKHTDGAGSSIDVAHFDSSALGSQGALLAYLPPGYASAAQRYPVVYLLHGNNQPASAFLQLGLQASLDRLIASHQVPPLIAVMIQGGRGANNWRNWGGRRGYESYVLEVQELVDRSLPTIAARGARAIAGDSMGGYGAMHIALSHPHRFSIVESWLGFFNGLESQLRAARPAIAREGLHAFLYGGASDTIADPSEDAPFAASLRAAGAHAHGVVYPGEHSMETLAAHLPHMLAYIGRALNANAPAVAPVSTSAR